MGINTRIVPKYMEMCGARAPRARYPLKMRTNPKGLCWTAKWKDTTSISPAARRAHHSCARVVDTI